MIIKKAGCILINKTEKKIALVYRVRKKDYTFPKGHLERGETLKQCAIRETREETGHDCDLISDNEIAVLRFTNSIGEKIENYFYLAIDDGIYEEKIEEEDKEILVWKNIEEVEEVLSYQNLKEFWLTIKEKIIEEIFDNEKI